MTNILEKSYLECEKITKSHYENFPVASFLIPKYLRKPVSAVYTFARIADDIADEGELELIKRKELLENYLDNFVRKNVKDNFHFIALFDTIEKFNIPEFLFTDLIDAFIQDTEKHRYCDFNEVLHYCKRSANPVGRILLKMFGYNDSKLDFLSDKICTALQLTNFWQDIGIDIKKDRVYIPLDELKTFNISENDLLLYKNSDNLRKLIQFQVERTNNLFVEGEELLFFLKGLFKYEIKLTINGGKSILKKIQEINFNTIEQRPELGTLDKLKIFLSLF